MAKWFVALALLAGMVAPTAAVASAEQRAAREWVTNDAALALIQKSEGLRLVSYSNGGVWRIGYGHSTNVTKGQTITATQAATFLKADIKACETALAKLIVVPVTASADTQGPEPI